jgi:acyl phosphate:glycerol-3-phosphate acyltransferase
MREALVLGAAYLLGAIPFAWLIARAAGAGDLRRRGSGNVGATNVLRTAGLVPGLIALVLDVGKGVAAVALAQAASVGEDASAAAGLLAVAGHVFPVWLRGRGGKGVATAAGVFAMVAPGALGFAVVIFVATVVTWRYVAAGSLLATAALVSAIAFGGYPRATLIVAIATAVLVVVRHADNIARLRHGSEPRVTWGSNQ